MSPSYTERNFQAIFFPTIKEWEKPLGLSRRILRNAIAHGAVMQKNAVFCVVGTLARDEDNVLSPGLLVGRSFDGRDVFRRASSSENGTAPTIGLPTIYQGVPGETNKPKPVYKAGNIPNGLQKRDKDYLLQEFPQHNAHVIMWKKS